MVTKVRYGAARSADLRSGGVLRDEASVLYAAPADLHGWGPTERIARHRRYSMPELIAYLQANATVGGQPVRLFSR
jgi:hypothetical protein